MQKLKRKTAIAIASCDRIIRKATNYRVSESASKFLARELERYAIYLVQKANPLVKHASKKTIKARDLRFAKAEL